MERSDADQRKSLGYDTSDSKDVCYDLVVKPDGTRCVEVILQPDRPFEGPTQRHTIREDQWKSESLNGQSLYEVISKQEKTQEPQ